METYSRKYDWIRIAESLTDIQFSEKKLAEIKIGERDICLALTQSGLKACGATCPHAGARLAKVGKLDAKDNLVCCVHQYSFNLTHGRDTFNEGFFLKIYPIEIREDGVFVGL